MNRAELVRTVLVWQTVADRARDRAAIARTALTEQARDEWSVQGVAPTWRMPDLATVTLPVSHESITVTDVEALTKWVAQRYPEEIERIERIREAFLSVLPGRLRADGGVVCDPGTGEIVPGVGVRAGGVPGTLSVRPTADARAVLVAAAEDILVAVGAALDEPHDEQP
jgi:hypothetical protein